jgi:hypothetical protein
MMSVLIRSLRELALEFDDGRYPSDVYFHLLGMVRDASTAEAMGGALAQMLAWKDGKVRRDQSGPHVTTGGATRYLVGMPKPNTYSARHAAILSSDAFFAWAADVRKIEHFEPALIGQMQQFGLWNSVVIPVMVLHALNPRIFPIVDRWVLLAHRLLCPSAQEGAGMAMSVDSYIAYQPFWLDLLAEAQLAPMSAQLGQLKELDAGLWVLGKRAAALCAGALVQEADGDDTADDSTAHAPALGSDSEQFKRRAVALRNEGRTQAQAIREAAAEFGIDLKPSYLRYPGSHFDRWRKQGMV